MTDHTDPLKAAIEALRPFARAYENWNGGNAISFFGYAACAKDYMQAAEAFAALTASAAAKDEPVAIIGVGPTGADVSKLIADEAAISSSQPVAGEQKDRIGAKMPDGSVVTNVYDAFAAGGRFALSQAKEQVPTIYQVRSRPMWFPEGKGWSAWTECKKESFADYQKVPELNDWQYEVRQLFAAPVQQSPIKDHVIAQTVNQLRDIAIQFHASGQLRERIAHVIVPLLKGESVQQPAEIDSLSFTPDGKLASAVLIVRGERVELEVRREAKPAGYALRKPDGTAAVIALAEQNAKTAYHSHPMTYGDCTVEPVFFAAPPQAEAQFAQFAHAPSCDLLKPSTLNGYYIARLCDCGAQEQAEAQSKSDEEGGGK